MARSPDVTQLLERVRTGDASALDALFATLYDELRRLAQHHLRSERADLTLQATALVNEACMKLLGPASAGSFNDRGHLLAVASRAMRQVLVDHARARLARKRGGADRAFVTLSDDVAGETRDEANIIALHQALDGLTEVNERFARIVEMRFFAGLDHVEIAAILDISVRTVQRDWRTARAFLSRQLRDGAGATGTEDAP
jgi:RNA polymerase sigma factor (TIGR02999 family)